MGTGGECFTETVKKILFEAETYILLQPECQIFDLFITVMLYEDWSGVFKK